MSLCDSADSPSPSLSWTRKEKTSLLTADETGLMETPPVALYFLGMVHRLLTGCTLGAPSPVWHLGKQEVQLITSVRYALTNVTRHILFTHKQNDVALKQNYNQFYFLPDSFRR